MVTRRTRRTAIPEHRGAATRAAGSPPDGDALTRCVGDAKRFADEQWGRGWHVHHSAGFADLLNLDAVDRLLTEQALRTPALRVVREGVTLADEAITRPARMGSRDLDDLIDPARVFAAFDEGATIVLQSLHRYWPPVADLCRDLETTLTHPVQANAYLTPPVAQGLRVHADRHDVFALQCVGRKQWVIHDDGAEAPATADFALEAGDALYLSTGTPHAARTIDEASLHLTIGVRGVRWRDVLRRAVEQALDDDQAAEPLPVGFADAPESVMAEATDRLAALAHQLDAAAAAEAVAATAQRFHTRRIPSLRGQLGELIRLDDITADTRLERRPDTPATLRLENEHTVAVVLPDRELRFPARAEPALRRALAPPPPRVGDLDPLDAEGQRVLAKQLVRAGVLRAVQA